MAGRTDWRRTKPRSIDGKRHLAPHPGRDGVFCIGACRWAVDPSCFSLWPLWSCRSSRLLAGRGMLFDFKREQPVAMWMQNTYVSLDMIFIRDDGRIARIAESTEVLSERVIPSGVPVRAVLEVVAGTAKK